MYDPHVIGVTALATTYGIGQKLVSVAVEYNEELYGADLSVDCFAIDGFEITNVFTATACRKNASRKGRFVQLTLNSTGDETNMIGHTGRGRDARLFVHKPQITVSQLKPLQTVSGKELAPFEGRNADRIDRGMVDHFIPAVFTTDDGHELNYNLYMPERIVQGQIYPVVLFMHDAGSCSDDPSSPLVQGTGATVWAMEADYGRRPCFVVAPQYPNVCANDEFEVTWEADATVQLLYDLMLRYPIDSTRIYATGQSMGCMMICELMLRNPHFFAGCLLVAGQWDPVRMAAAKDENIWAIVSYGDAKAYPIMSECMKEMRKAGGRLSYGHIDARGDAAILDAAIRSQNERNCNLNFTWFEGRSVIPDGIEEHPGMHHIFTWTKAYDIKALREWLFEQRLL